MSDSLSNKELVAVGHQFAKAMSSDTPIIDMAKIVSRLAERLDCTTQALREATKQRDALAAELEARSLTIPDEIDFDHENEYGEHGGNGECWMRGRVKGFNEALGKVKRNAIAAGIRINGEG